MRKHALDERRRIARRYANERLAQPCLCRAVAHEAMTRVPRGEPTASVFAIEKSDITTALRLREARVEPLG